MIAKEIEIKNKLGLHARAAAKLVHTAARFKSSIKIKKGDEEVDGKSIMGLMMLAAEEGAKLVVMAEGPDEKDVLVMLEELFKTRFGEKD